MAGSMGSVAFVGAGPGDPDLITVRGLRRLETADVVLYDSLVDPRLLEGLRAEQVFVGKRCGKHSMRQEETTELLARLALEGKQVVRLKGGDPSVLGRVGEEAMRLAELGIPFEVVPGISSAIAVPAAAGMPVTHRGLADSFLVLSAHSQDEAAVFSVPPYNARTTLVLLMASRTVASWQRQLLGAGYPSDLPLALISAGMTKQQLVLTGTLAAAVELASQIDGAAPTMAVVGRVVSLRPLLTWAEASRVRRREQGIEVHPGPAT